MTKISEETRELLVSLSGAGGGWMNFWNSPGNAPVWWPAGHPPASAPEYWQNCYFSVAPRVVRLSGKRRGGLQDLKTQTALYSEMDCKDGKTWADIEILEPQPSAIVHSGGGWHCYWFIYPVEITGENLESLNEIQHRWVKFTGGDPGAPDISRVLRLPGSWNFKYSPAREVKILSLQPSLRYDLRDLQALLPEEKEPQGGLVGSGARPYQSPEPVLVDSEYWLNRALELANPGNRNRVGFWLACQLRDAGLSASESEGVLLRYQVQVDSRKDHFTKQEALANVRSAYKIAPRQPAAKV